MGIQFFCEQQLYSHLEKIEKKKNKKTLIPLTELSTYHDDSSLRPLLDFPLRGRFNVQNPFQERKHQVEMIPVKPRSHKNI